MILPFSEGVCEEDEVKPVVFSSTEGKEKKRKALTKTPSVKRIKLRSQFEEDDEIGPQLPTEAQKYDWATKTKVVFQEAMERKVR